MSRCSPLHEALSSAVDGPWSSIEVQFYLHTGCARCRHQLVVCRRMCKCRTPCHGGYLHTGAVLSVDAMEVDCKPGMAGRLHVDDCECLRGIMINTDKKINGAG